MKTFKNVVVIGAGPAGSSAAILLKRSGMNVTLIDKNVEVKRKVCGEYLCPIGVDLLNKLSLAPNSVNDFHQVFGMKIVSPNGTSFLSFFPEAANKSHYGLSLNRKVFDQELRTQAQNEGVNTIWGESLKDLTFADGQWFIQTDNNQLECDLVVAADGINSKVAKILNHSYDQYNKKRVAIHAYLKLKNHRYYNRLGQMHIFNDGAYCGIDPIDQDEINFSICYDVNKNKGLKPWQIINKYLKDSKDLNEMFELVDESTHISSTAKLKNKNNHIVTDQLAYIGDAAGFIDPLTGEGIYNAINSAKTLAVSLKISCNQEGLDLYKINKIIDNSEKNNLNNFFQFLIKVPFLCNIVANFFKSRQTKANIFVGIIGNIYSPVNGIRKILFS